ncbi:unnamed protein product [Eretmochelys imbricata]
MMAEAGEPYTYYANALNMSRITSAMAVPIPFGAYTRWKINSAAVFRGAREGKMGTLLAPTTAPLSLCSPGPGALRRFHGPGDCATEIVSITTIQKIYEILESTFVKSECQLLDGWKEVSDP